MSDPQSKTERRSGPPLKLVLGVPLALLLALFLGWIFIQQDRFADRRELARTIAPGASMDDVRAVLGEPDKTHFGLLTLGRVVWSYETPFRSEFPYYWPIEIFDLDIAPKVGSIVVTFDHLGAVQSVRIPE